MALTATAFVYVVLPTNAQASRGPDPRAMGRIENGERIVRIRAEMTAASSGSAYPTSGGVPLSTTASNWGMIRNLDYVQFIAEGHTGTGLATSRPAWHYNPTAHSMIGLETNFTLVNPSVGATTVRGLSELATTWTPTLAPYNTVFYFVAHGW